jgi:hypothetical protein
MQYHFSKFSACRCSSVFFLLKVGREKKKRVWRQFCEWLSAAVPCLPVAVNLLLLEALFMQISGVSLALTWPSRLCLLRVLCTMTLLQAFHFPSTLEEVILHLFSQACVFIYSSHGKWVFPLSYGVFLPPPLLQAFPLLIAGPVLLLLLTGMVVYSSRGRWVFPHLLWSFPPSATLTSFPAPGCWVLLPSPSRPGLFIYSSRRDFPSLLFGAQGAPPSLLCVFIVLIAYYSVSLFSPGGGWSVQGAMLIWPRVVCGNTVYHLAHIVHVFPSRLGAGDWWQPRDPPGFSVQCEVRCYAQAGGVQGSKVCLFSVALPAKCVSSISPRSHFRRHASYFLPLATIFGINPPLFTAISVTHTHYH